MSSRRTGEERGEDVAVNSDARPFGGGKEMRKEGGSADGRPFRF